MGLKNAGFKVLAAIEIDEIASETYSENHPEVAVTTTDIRRVDPLRWMRDLGLSLGDLTLMASCAPCQGFSTIRTRNAREPADDPRNDLVFEILRFAEVMLPQAILMENVPGLRHDRRFDELLNGLRKLGYRIGDGPWIANAADYGVPQNRRRLVLMAARFASITIAPMQPFRATVRSAIGALQPPGDTGDPLHDLPERRSARVQTRIAAVPKDGGGRFDLPHSLRLDCHATFDGFKDVYGRMAWDRPAPTITGGCFNPSKGRFLHPEQNRNITLREAALLQGFPADYWFSLRGGKVKAASMIGNALPPRFVEAQARPIATALGAIYG